MKVIKKTADYLITQRKDKRYAVKDSNKKPVNGDEKIRILVQEGLIEVKVKAPEPEPEVAEAVEEAAAEESAAAADAEPEGEEAPAE